MAFEYDLTLGLPHTNYRGLSEPLLLAHAGHFQWASIAAAAGTPLSRLRTVSGGEVYAAFYYIEEEFPAARPLESFGLDDTLRFAISMRAFKNIAIEGRVVFDRIDRATGAAAGDSPRILFGNIFITPEKGNRRLRVAPPAGADFSALPTLPRDENPYELVQLGGEHGRLGLLEDGWSAAGSFEHTYQIDSDRDTNGAGLVYFANYVAFMEAAERHALAHLDVGMPADAVSRRTVRHRRIGYYGNAEVTDTISVRVTAMTRADSPQSIGLRYQIARQGDGQTICLSEAVKVVPA